MALSTYADLKTAVAAWLNRSDLTSVIPDFVSLAEADIRRDVTVPAMETLASGTTTGETIALPTNFLKMRRFTIGGANYEFVIPEVYTGSEDSGAHYYTIIGQSIYVLDGTSGLSYTLLYYGAFTALSGAGDTNWLLTYHPDVYLFGAVKYGAAYLMDAEQQAAAEARYTASVGRCNGQAQQATYGDLIRVRSM